MRWLDDAFVLLLDWRLGGPAPRAAPFDVGHVELLRQFFSIFWTAPDCLMPLPTVRACVRASRRPVGVGRVQLTVSIYVSLSRGEINGTFSW